MFYTKIQYPILGGAFFIFAYLLRYKTFEIEAYI